ncbi:uncharacterized protein METZ01_LOCUS144165, partial [marine metagenome]
SPLYHGRGRPPLGRGSFWTLLGQVRKV